MPQVEDFGERAATATEVTDWKAMVKAGRRATRAFRQREGAVDSMRPSCGSGQASSEERGA